jgi:hypothetical protein
MYLITEEQFNDLVMQENSLSVDGNVSFRNLSS